uniref:Uncharacterized protein n=1 Tax=Panagrolaimus sp. PS1159 TaxID=55785 RepID=A0AC35EZD4_9BILA
MTFSTENQVVDDQINAAKKSRKFSHRCCITCETKCEELQKQVISLTEKLKAAEAETEKLKSLLKSSVDQKLLA